MRRYRTEIDNVRAHLRSLWVVIGAQFIVILALWFGWSQAPKQLTIHVPPDLRSGASLSVDEVPAANVYAFAFYIFQQLNRWSQDGAKDYGKAIFRISPYVTPRYGPMIWFPRCGPVGQIRIQVTISTVRRRVCPVCW